MRLRCQFVDPTARRACWRSEEPGRQCVRAAWSASARRFRDRALLPRALDERAYSVQSSSAAAAP